MQLFFDRKRIIAVIYITKFLVVVALDIPYCVIIVVYIVASKKQRENFKFF